MPDFFYVRTLSRFMTRVYSISTSSYDVLSDDVVLGDRASEAMHVSDTDPSMWLILMPHNAKICAYEKVKKECRPKCC